MSLTPGSSMGSESLVSLQLSAISSPSLGCRRDSSSSESSSCTVMPVTRPHPRGNVQAAQDAAPVRRNRVSQKHKKIRSRLTGLATPFHVDTRRRPQGVLLPMRRPDRTLRRKGRKRLTNVDTVGNKSSITRSLTYKIPQRVMPEILALLSQIY